MRLAVSALWRIHETNPNCPITSNDMNKFYIKALDRAPYSDHFYEAVGLLKDKLEELKIFGAQQRVAPTTGRWMKDD